MIATQLVLSMVFALLICLTVGAQGTLSSKELAAESVQFRSLMRSSRPLQLKLTEFAGRNLPNFAR